MALATSAAHATLTDDDRLAAEALRRRGFQAVPLVWSGPGTPGAPPPAAMVIRSCWDYHHHPAAFLAFLEETAAGGAAVFNPPALVRWNAHKGYLRDLARAGVRIPPTRVVERGTEVSLASLRAELAAEVLVVKPAVSASAEGLWRTGEAPSPEEETRLREAAHAHDVLVQAYLPEVAERGEWSLVYLGGAYSHAVLKRPARGDFRTQRELGGTARAGEPPAGVRAAAERALGALPEAPLYARVDLSAGAVLMEMELIEPELYFGLHPPAAGSFAAALAAALAR